MNPTVSVIVPNYNREKYIEPSIESILYQTFQDIEIIIINEAFPDNSCQIVEQYCGYPKVSQIIFNEKNSNFNFFLWNKRFDLDQGKYIWIAHFNDIVILEFLSILVTKLEENPSVNLAYCQTARIDSDGKATGTWRIQTQNLKNLKKFANFLIINSKKFIL